MSKYNLTDKQKDLLIKLVHSVENGKVREPIITAISSGGDHILGIGEDLGPNLLGDLDSLCDVEFLGWRYNSRGNKIYTIKQAGYDAVENDFEMPDDLALDHTMINIGAYVQSMSGGQVQSVGFANKTELDQIVNDPRLLQDKIEILTDNLIEVVKSNLDARQLSEYIKSADELREIASSEEVDPSIIKRIISTLSFLGDVEGSIELMKRVWPIVYPLLIILTERMVAIAQ